MTQFLRTRTYPAVLTFVSIAILVAGVLLKPQKANTETAPVSEYETMRLQQMAQKKSLEDMMAFLSAIAADAGERVVYRRQARASGIAWTSGSIVTTAAPPAGEEEAVILSRGRAIAAHQESSDGPLALLRLAAGSVALKPVSKLRPEAAVRGSWVVQVSRASDGATFFTPGLYRGTAPVTCGEAAYREIDTSIELTPRTLGGGIFDLDGRLLGIVARCDGRLAAISSSDVEAALHPPISQGAMFEKEWGARFAPLDETAREYFRAEEGLLVQEVRRGGAADGSGWKPGDVLIAVNDTPVQSLEDLAKVAAVASGVRATIVRGRRRLILPLPAARTDGPDGQRDGEIGLRLEGPPAGFAVASVAPGSAARRAGLLLGDRLLEVNGTRVRRLDDVTRLLKRSAGGLQYLVVSRGDRQIGLFVP